MAVRLMLQLQLPVCGKTLANLVNSIHQNDSQFAKVLPNQNVFEIFWMQSRGDLLIFYRQTFGKHTFTKNSPLQYFATYR